MDKEGGISITISSVLETIKKEYDKKHAKIINDITKLIYSNNYKDNDIKKDISNFDKNYKQIIWLNKLDTINESIKNDILLYLRTKYFKKAYNQTTKKGM